MMTAPKMNPLQRLMLAMASLVLLVLLAGSCADEFIEVPEEDEDCEDDFEAESS